MKVEKQIIEQEIFVYVAEDGKRFKTERECKQYETECVLKKQIEMAEKLRIVKLDEFIPLSNQEFNENNTFVWYEVKNKEDFDALNKAYAYELKEPSLYPEIICVETTGYEAYMDDAYGYNLRDLKQTTEDFWEKFGYKVTFECL